MQHFSVFPVNIPMQDYREHESDLQIVQAVLNGDQNAFRILIHRYQRLVAHVVFRMVYHAADREDICQDVFIKMYNNLATFRFDCKLSTWITRIAYHTCLNFIRKKKNPLLEDYLKPEQCWEDIPGREDLPDSLAENMDRQVKLEQEIGRLPETYRIILTLYHLEDMTYQEIGEVLDIPQGTVKSYLHRARRMLKEAILSKYEMQEI